MTSTPNRWHRPDMRRPSHFLTRSDDGDRVLRSPGHIQANPSTLSVAETAGQVLEEGEREGGEPGLSRCLAVMEDRKRRMEEMLVKLTESLSYCLERAAVVGFAIAPCLPYSLATFTSWSRSATHFTD